MTAELHTPALQVPQPAFASIGTAAAANAALLVDGYAAFGRGDLERLAQVFSPDVTWHVRRLGQLSGDHVGWPALGAFFRRTAELTAGTFRITVLEVLANDQGAAAILRSQGERNGRTLDDRQIHQYRIRDGRIVEAWQYPGDPDATEAFWA